MEKHSKYIVFCIPALLPVQFGYSKRTELYTKNRKNDVPNKSLPRELFEKDSND